MALLSSRALLLLSLAVILAGVRGLTPLGVTRPLARAGRMGGVALQERDKTVDELLAAADEKLEALNEVPGFKAPASLADLGLPPEAPPPPAVSPLLSFAPIVVGAFAFFLFLFNQFGLFGDGAELVEWANSLEETPYKNL